jgi:hypothetical protein
LYPAFWALTVAVMADKPRMPITIVQKIAEVVFFIFSKPPLLKQFLLYPSCALKSFSVY